MSAPLGAGVELASSVVQFVQRSTEPVVIGDASNAGMFAGDPYLAARPPRSILCVAMMRKGALTGALYLENHAAREAFTPALVEVVTVLASQAAIAVENAQMVAELRRRTDALGEANEAMRAANERLSLELFEREQAEAARTALKKELMRVQTPLIPITDRIMVMPLIGVIDAPRAQAVLESALAGAAERRCEVVILDITGVKKVDEDVIGTLVSTTAALRLLGTQAVVTGVRPEVAQALVAMGVDLRAMLTLGTLQQGIAYAMDRREAAARRR
jgi:anti-anti-sigma regulatory factor